MTIEVGTDVSLSSNFKFKFVYWDDYYLSNMGEDKMIDMLFHRLEHFYGLDMGEAQEMVGYLYSSQILRINRKRIFYKNKTFVG